MPSSAAAPPGRREAIELARRIDWRFLLPSPHLGQVAYVGSLQEDLLDALRYFCDRLVYASDAPAMASAQSPPAGFDLLVLRGPHPAAVGQLAGRLKTGGHLYWEIDRCTSPAGDRRVHPKTPQPRAARVPRPSRLVHALAYPGQLDALTRFGFGQIQVHWHRPDFHRCLEMIPLDAHPPIRHIFSRPKRGLAAAARATAGRISLNRGLLARLAACISVIATRNPQGDSGP